MKALRPFGLSVILALVMGWAHQGYAACSPIVTSPANVSTVGGTINITVTAAGCTGNWFIRVYTGVTAGHDLATFQFPNNATSASFNTVGLPNGTYTMAVIVWDSSGLIKDGTSPAVSYTIANGASASPTPTAGPTATAQPTSPSTPAASPTPAPSATPTPGGIQPIGNPALPPGTTHWVLTSDSEFNSTGLDTSLWNGGGGVLNGTDNLCPNVFGGLGYGATCPDEYYGTLGSAPYETLNPGTGAQIQGEITDNASNYAWATLQTLNNFAQRYGYWEIMAKQPHDSSGEGDGAHPDIWMSVPCRNGFGGSGTCQDEVDIAENYLSTQSCAVSEARSGLYDGSSAVAESVPMPNKSVGDLSSGFHAYGAQWAPPGANGSTGSQGSWQFFFDGGSQSGPYGINDGAWSEGVYLFLYDDFFTAGSSTFWCGTPATGNTSNNDPLVVKYVRIWQAE